MLTLQAHGNAWIEFMLDPNSGSYQQRRVAAPTPPGARPFHGFASIEPLWGVRRRFYAIYPHNDGLWFQAGRRRWDITDGFAVCKFWWLLWGAASGLRLVFKNGDSLSPFLIHPNRALIRLVDPTYDGLDEETDHFFMFVREYAVKEDWRRYVRGLRP